MNRLSGVGRAVIVCLSLGAVTASAAPPTSDAPLVDPVAIKKAHRDYLNGQTAAHELAQVTGVAFTPLMGVAAVGAWSYMTAPANKRGHLGFGGEPLFFLPLLALTGLLRFGGAIPGIKRFFKAASVFESKISALLFLPMTSIAFSSTSEGREAVGSVVLGFVSPTAWAADGTVGGGEELNAFVGGVVVTLVGFIVWLSGHAVRVLCLVSPSMAIDAMLKSTKAVLLAVLIIAHAISPWAALAVIAVYSFVALLMAGWSFRLTVFGAVFCLDVLRITGRRSGASPFVAFSSRLPGLPARTFGRVIDQGDGLAFEWRPWLVLKRRQLSLQAPAAIERGFIHPVLVDADDSVLVRFPPRFRTQSLLLAESLKLPHREPPVLRGLAAIRAWMASMFGKMRRAATPSARAGAA